MLSASFWWQRHRWTLIFSGAALALGAAAGSLAEAVVSLPAPQGSRPTFYIELFFAAIGALALVFLLLSRAAVGLPILLGVLAVLPSRTGMQWRYSGFLVVSVTDLVLLLGIAILLLRTKIRRKERLRPVAIARPLWLWLAVGVVGLIVAVARGVPWVNYVPEIKGFYLWILIAILCVNVIRTRLALWALMVATVLSALPNVVLSVRNVQTGTDVLATTLPDGEIVYRSAGSAGLINQFAFYMMVVFFIALGLALTSRRWPARLFFFGCAGFLVVGVYLTYTRGAWLALALGVLVVAATGGRRVLVGAALTAIIGYALFFPLVEHRLSFSDHSVATRVALVRTGTTALRANPLLGGGWGSNYILVGSVLVPLFDANDLPFWHDDFLIVATQVGLPGLAIFASIWLWLVGAILRARRRAPPGPLPTYLIVLLAALVAILAQATTDMFFWRVETGPLIWLVVGFACAAINLVDDEARGPQSSLLAAPLTSLTAGTGRALPAHEAMAR